MVLDLILVVSTLQFLHQLVSPLPITFDGTAHWIPISLFLASFILIDKFIAVRGSLLVIILVHRLVFGIHAFLAIEFPLALMFRWFIELSFCGVFVVASNIIVGVVAIVHERSLALLVKPAFEPNVPL